LAGQSDGCIPTLNPGERKFIPITLVSPNASEICTATRLYFLEVVKARAVAAQCKSGTERERDLGRFDVDVAHANEAIAARCL